MEGKWKTTAMLVIDLQNDQKSLQQPGGQTIIPNVIKAVEVASRRGILIIWVAREHDPLRRDVELHRLNMYGIDKKGPNIKGSTVGAELVNGLEIQNGYYKLVKTRFSDTNLHSVLWRVGIDSLVVTGAQTLNSIRQTAFEAVAMDYPSITVITEPQQHRHPKFMLKTLPMVTTLLQAFGFSSEKMGEFREVCDLWTPKETNTYWIENDLATWGT